MQHERWAAWNESVSLPAFRLSVWLTVPVPCTNAVWTPSGAATAPQALPLPWMPLCESKVHPMPEPLGLYWYPLPSPGVSKLALTREDAPPEELTTCVNVALIDPLLAASPL